MKKQMLGCFSLLLLATILNAEPKKCPDAEEIKKIGLNYMIIVDHNWQAAFMPSHDYGTKQNWSFMIGGGQLDTVESLDDAWKQALLAMRSLKYAIGPIKMNQSWACYYRTGQQASGIAVTPPQEIEKMQRLVR